MSSRISSSVDDWALTLLENQIAEALGLLELRVEGNTFHRIAHLTQWVLGNYSETDFENSTEPAEAVVRRKRLREELIQAHLISDTDDDALLEATGDVTHPLQQAREDPEVQANLYRITGVSHQSTEFQAPETARTAEEEPTDGVDATATPLRLTSTDGKEFAVTRELSALLVQLIERVNSMHNQVHKFTRVSASSTRLEPRRQSTLNIRFQDTFSIAGDNSYSSPLEPNRRNAWPQMNPGPPPRNPVWEGGESSSYWPGSSFPTRDSQASRWNSSNRDIGQVVPKGQIRFSEAKSQGIDVFLARLEDCRTLANLTEEEVLSLLSEIFTDTAATWYRNE